MLSRTIAGVAAAAAMLGLATAAGQAQTATPSTQQSIIGADIREQEASAATDAARVIAAIEKSAENAQRVRKMSKTPAVEIVFLSDAAQAAGGPPAEIEARIRERQHEVTLLRQEIEGNALLYHAIDSRQILLRDVLALEISAAAVTVYAAAKPAN